MMTLHATISIVSVKENAEKKRKRTTHLMPSSGGGWLDRGAVVNLKPSNHALNAFPWGVCTNSNQWRCTLSSRATSNTCFEEVYGAGSVEARRSNVSCTGAWESETKERGGGGGPGGSRHQTVTNTNQPTVTNWIWHVHCAGTESL